MAKRRAKSQIANLTPDQKKSRIDLIYLVTRGVWHTVRKLLTRATTLLWTTSQSKVCSQSYGAPKLREFHLARFHDFHSEVPGEKSHLDVSSVASHKVYYKGEGGGFPQVQAVVSLVCLRCPWLLLAPKVLQLCIKHFVWVVCKPVWVSEACQLFLVPSRSSNTPLYPSKCCELRNVPWFLPFPRFSIWTHIWVLRGIGVRHRTWMAKKALKTPNNNNGVRRSTQVKYPVQKLTYDGFVAHHYTYMVRVIHEVEPTYFE